MEMTTERPFASCGTADVALPHIVGDIGRVAIARAAWLH